MPISKISINNLLDLKTEYILFDVRSEAEYEHAHIPNAINLPIFNNDERRIIGTTYKQKSREEAIKIGLDFFGPKMSDHIKKVALIAKQKNCNQIIVHCARGGMRSAAMCWLLDFYGFQVAQIVDGYKAYRNWVLQSFEKDYKLKIIGGCTGSAKTEVLHELQNLNTSIIDLEAIACHKGSTFGAIEMPSQPSQEMFENILAQELFFKQKNTIYIEDESQRIGLVNIPSAFWQTMRASPIIYLEIGFEHRLQHIVAEYSVFNHEALHDSILRIQRNLGGLDCKNAIDFLSEKNYTESFSILLKYYDKYYTKGLMKRENWEDLKNDIICENADPYTNARKVLNFQN